MKKGQIYRFLRNEEAVQSSKIHCAVKKFDLAARWKKFVAKWLVKTFGGSLNQVGVSIGKCWVQFLTKQLDVQIDFRKWKFILFVYFEDTVLAAYFWLNWVELEFDWASE